jgi:tetratricopeptide (TPR) repeat protein
LGWKWRALACNELRDHARSLEYAKRALELDPTASNTRLDVATCLSNLGKREEAIAYEEEERARYPQNPTFYQQMAIRFMNRGDPAAALEAAAKAAELGPELPTSWELHVLCAGAVAEVDHGKAYARAVAGLLICFMSNPNVNLREWMTTACYLGERKHYFVAARLHSALVARFPTAANWYNFGVTLHKMGKPDGAYECYSKAIEVEHATILALANRGWIAFDRGDLDRAEKDWKSALQQDPQHIVAIGLRMIGSVGIYKVKQNPELVANAKKFFLDFISLTYDI